MAFYRRSYNKSAAARTRVRRVAKGGFAASPAGKHRRLALNAFALAKRARTAGNLAHFRRMLNFGKRALALSKTEVRMWKKGKALRARAFAAHRAVRTAAKARTTRFAYS